MENESHRSSKRIVLDSDEEEEEQVLTPQPDTAREVISKADGLSGLFDENDYEELEDNDEVKGDLSGDEEEEEDTGLFGDDEENEDENQEAGYDSYGQDDQEIEIEQREMDLVIPRYPPSHKPSEDTYFVQVPTFLTIDAHAFDPTDFLRSAEEKHLKDGDNIEKSQSQRLHNVNTIRWKFSRDGEGNMIKESNSRYIKWSDGSLSLQLGSEIFDVIEKPNPDVFLAMSHPAQEVLQTSALLKKSMSFVPTSTSSETHKRLREELQKQQLSSSIVVGNYATTDDPEKIKREAEKAEEINLKARKKLEQKRKQLEGRDGYDLGGSSRGERGGNAASRYDSQDMYASTGGRGGDQYEEDDFVVQDEEDDDEDDARARRLKDVKRKGAESYKKSRRQFSDEEEEEEAEDEEEEPEAAFTDDNSDGGRSRHSSTKKKRRIVGDEDSDEE